MALPVSKFNDIEEAASRPNPRTVEYHCSNAIPNDSRCHLSQLTFAFDVAILYDSNKLLDIAYRRTGWDGGRAWLGVMEAECRLQELELENRSI
ncbi:hypothetical protein CRG98_024596 [Punica granatum]|uniref:Uncharacterized protein n=1 Tax=Punica granatum TaxID=22663 RepID=A0A2I0JH99_PUNGR|nr:hypothetical protein CRG98_024596 [Punica granatum]